MSGANRRWCFTLNNPTPDDLDRLRDCLGNYRYGVFGREVAPTTGTPHLQGFFILNNGRSRNALLQELPQMHLEVARGTSQQAADYCKKDGDYEEFGNFPANQGKRTDIQNIMSWLDEFIEDNKRAPSPREVAVHQPTALLRYNNFMHLARLRAPEPTLQEGDTRPWQRELEDLLDLPADDRSIRFYIDAAGGEGKTWFQKYYFTKHSERVQLLGVGKRDDMAYAIDESKGVFLINVPRGGMEYLQYTILEQLKDRMVFSTKYQACMKIINTTPHVIVFCNEQPEMDKMSEDRYVINHLN